MIVLQSCEKSHDTVPNKQPFSKGIGPIRQIHLMDEIDRKRVDDGKILYRLYCENCHDLNEDYLGPSPKGILKRRSPEWVMNMILNPIEMTEKDSIAKALFKKYKNLQMITQGLTEKEARDILEMFRTL